MLNWLLQLAECGERWSKDCLGILQLLHPVLLEG